MSAPRHPVLPDSSVCIDALRRGLPPFALLQNLQPGSLVWLSAVVLEELYAGAWPRDRGAIERLETDYARLNRILVPSLSDWTWAGHVLAKLGAKHGYEQIGRGRLTNDALIAMGAARHGMVVLTTNDRDFRRIAEFRPFRWEVLKPVSGA